jgi:hypothetical protein
VQEQVVGGQHGLQVGITPPRLLAALQRRHRVLSRSHRRADVIDEADGVELIKAVLQQGGGQD